MKLCFTIPRVISVQSLCMKRCLCLSIGKLTKSLNEVYALLQEYGLREAVCGDGCQHASDDFLCVFRQLLEGCAAQYRVLEVTVSVTAT